jgi:signal transduction histidine kinase
LRERAVQLEAEREQNARVAVAEERARIARELHDVVAHSVSVMVVQAQAGPRLLAQADAARDAFGSIEHVGRGALVELRRLLGVLRTDDQQLATAPQPGLESLPLLIDRVRASGLPVNFSVEGEPVTLPLGIGLSAYRIVQEALTNTIKHAGPATSDVVVRYDTYVLEIRVADDGTGPVPGASDAGHGLIGMAERVGIYGGELTTGPRDGRGFQVCARLPINGVPR